MHLNDNYFSRTTNRSQTQTKSGENAREDIRDHKVRSSIDVICANFSSLPFLHVRIVLLIMRSSSSLDVSCNFFVKSLIHTHTHVCIYIFCFPIFGLILYLMLESRRIYIHDPGNGLLLENIIFISVTHQSDFVFNNPCPGSITLLLFCTLYFQLIGFAGLYP